MLQLPLLAQDDDEALMNELEAQQKIYEQMLERTKNLANTKNAENKTDTVQDVVKSLDHMQAMYRQASVKESKAHLQEKVKGKPFIDDPRFINFADAYLRDPRALKDIVSILNDHKKLSIFAGINIALFIIIMVYKRIRAKKIDQSFFLFRFFKWVFSFIFFTGIRFGLVVLFYGNNFSRSIELVKIHYF